MFFRQMLWISTITGIVIYTKSRKNVCFYKMFPVFTRELPVGTKDKDNRVKNT